MFTTRMMLAWALCLCIFIIHTLAIPTGTSDPFAAAAQSNLSSFLDPAQTNASQIPSTSAESSGYFGPAQSELSKFLDTPRTNASQIPSTSAESSGYFGPAQSELSKFLNSPQTNASRTTLPTSANSSDLLTTTRTTLVSIIIVNATQTRLLPLPQPPPISDIIDDLYSAATANAPKTPAKSYSNSTTSPSMTEPPMTDTDETPTMLPTTTSTTTISEFRLLILPPYPEASDASTADANVTTTSPLPQLTIAPNATAFDPVRLSKVAGIVFPAVLGGVGVPTFSIAYWLWHDLNLAYSNSRTLEERAADWIREGIKDDFHNDWRRKDEVKKAREMGDLENFMLKQEGKKKNSRFTKEQWEKVGEAVFGKPSPEPGPPPTPEPPDIDGHVITKGPKDPTDTVTTIKKGTKTPNAVTTPTKGILKTFTLEPTAFDTKPGWFTRRFGTSSLDWRPRPRTTIETDTYEWYITREPFPPEETEDNAQWITRWLATKTFDRNFGNGEPTEPAPLPTTTDSKGKGRATDPITTTGHPFSDWYLGKYVIWYGTIPIPAKDFPTTYQEPRQWITRWLATNTRVPTPTPTQTPEYVADPAPTPASPPNTATMEFVPDPTPTGGHHKPHCSVFRWINCCGFEWMGLETGC